MLDQAITSISFQISNQKNQLLLSDSKVNNTYQLLLSVRCRLLIKVITLVITLSLAIRICIIMLKCRPVLFSSLTSKDLAYLTTTSNKL